MQADTLNLIGQIYDTVSEPVEWYSFLDNLAVAMGAHAARMRVLDTNHGSREVIAGTGHDSNYDDRYREHYSKVDLLNPVLSQYKPGKIIFSDQLIPKNTLLNSEMYNDFWRHYDVYYGLGVNLIKTEDYIARIGIHRARTQGPFNEKAVQLLQDLSPHLLRAFKLSTHFHELQAKAEGVETALYHSSTPLLLIDENAKVVFANQGAESILNNESGLSVLDNQIKLPLNTEQSQLQGLLSQAIETGLYKGKGAGGALRVTAADGEHRYNLVITPYPARAINNLGLNSRICAAVFIHNNRNHGILSPELVKTLYGLTPSEIRLAEAIMDGLTPAEAATKFDVSVNTTRSQLRSLFNKTNTQRQADLVRLLSTLIGIS